MSDDHLDFKPVSERQWPAVPRDYEATGVDQGDRTVYARKRAERPSYLRENPEGTVIEERFRPGYDRVSFPIMKRRDIMRMGEQDFKSEEGTLWRFQRAIADAKFDLLKQCIGEGEHMVSDIQAHIVVEFEVRSLTNKAKMIVRVPANAELASVLLPRTQP